MIDEWPSSKLYETWKRRLDTRPGGYPYAKTRHTLCIQNVRHTTGQYERKKDIVEIKCGLICMKSLLDISHRAKVVYNPDLSVTPDARSFGIYMVNQIRPAQLVGANERPRLLSQCR